MSERKVTLSVVSHGQRALVERLLEDLHRLRPPSLALIVITINVPEAWEPPALVAGVPLQVRRNMHPAGFATNHNQAFAACETPCFAVVNPDIRLLEDPFPLLLQAMKEGRRCALVVPWQIDPSGRTEDFRRQLPTPWSILRRALARGPRGAGRLTSGDRVDWLAGSFMLLDSGAFHAVGGFDGRFRLYCEDTDLCIRLRAAGWHFAVVDETRVIHDAQRSSGRNLRHLSWHLQSFLRLWSSPRFWFACIRRRH